ncbi:RNA-guided endonuclease InsQ/TnpB family protein [Tenuibacillus multivorans]|uniref:Transposase, IS605 OrfB family, central region n=1 Tax=Tenuibacillus multivorans TaxID=237069 RepID=A0A1G9WUV5_9BACI|nr:RNA-guided endonuclease TnpB family protein [Tenuibacillus multivorans]GEL78416.1 transposase [Tenuibacillus multivorans]SDM88248.1 transposase, IS605 OrfB family, central region [Tenuibacillus multivorans]
MEFTLTAKVKINPTTEQAKLLQDTVHAYRKGCNFVSNIIFESKLLSPAKLHKRTYRELRSIFGLRSQMAQSVMKTVISKYKTNQSNGHQWSLVGFKKPQYDLVWNRDYSLAKGLLSVNTLQGRIKVPFNIEAMEQYFDGTWTFGTSKLVHKHGKWFLHIPITKDVPEIDEHDVNQVVGIDFGLNFVATTYDSKDETTFFKGCHIKHKRARYKHLRQQLQQKQTPSARRRLKAIGQRENRWMQDVNHCISKALVDQYGKHTLFVVEDLTGVRQVTEKVRLKDRYQTVSWSFYDLRQKLEYKAIIKQAKVMAVDPKYTSQTCPKCGHTDKVNRNKMKHVFCCVACHYTSNDDRIGAMNLQRKGIEYLAEVTS